MNDLSSLGKGLVFFGITIALVGLALIVLPKVPFLGKLPGDIFIKRENFTVYFPIATSLLLSVLLTVILNFLRNK